jgi:electron transfer flavoprotein beta subunit
MAAKKAVIAKRDAQAIGAEEGNLGLKGSPTQVKNIFAPQSKINRKTLEGTLEQQVDALIGELRSMKCV